MPHKQGLRRGYESSNWRCEGPTPDRTCLAAEQSPPASIETAASGLIVRFTNVQFKNDPNLGRRIARRHRVFKGVVIGDDTNRILTAAGIFLTAAASPVILIWVQGGLDRCGGPFSRRCEYGGCPAGSRRAQVSGRPESQLLGAAGGHGRCNLP